MATIDYGVQEGTDRGKVSTRSLFKRFEVAGQLLVGCATVTNQECENPAIDTIKNYAPPDGSERSNSCGK